MTERSPFKYFKTNPEIIRLAVMLFVRFALSLRSVNGLLCERRLTSRSNFNLNRTLLSLSGGSCLQARPGI